MADLKILLGDSYKEGMSVEDIEQALSDKELIDKTVLSSYVPKATADKYATEAADFKKKYNSKLSEDELKDNEQRQEREGLELKYNELLKETTIAKHKARFLGLGYDESLASETATALAIGEVDKVFENQSKFITLKEKAIKAELIRQTPPPPIGDTGTQKVDYTKEIEIAQRNSDYTKVAYYTRLAEQENKKE